MNIVAKRIETQLLQPKGAEGPWTLMVVFTSAPGIEDPELLRLGLDTVYKWVQQLPVHYWVEDQRKEAKDGQHAPE